MKKFNNLLAATLFAGAMIAGAGAAHASLGVDFTTPADTFSNDATTNYVVGWQFTTDDKLAVYALGFFLPTPNTKSTVGLWDATTQQLLAQADVDYTSPLKGNNFHFTPINPVILDTGKNYIVAGTTTDANLWTAFDTTDPNATNFTGLIFNNVSFAQDSFIDSSTLLFPDGTANQNPGTGLANATIIGGFGANLDANPVPEPGTIVLLGAGLIALVGLKRKNHK